MLSITYNDRKGQHLGQRETTFYQRYNQQCANNEVVLGRAHQPPQRRSMDLARRKLDNKKTKEKTSQAVERRPGQTLAGHDLAEDSTRQGKLEAAC